VQGENYNSTHPSEDAELTADVVVVGAGPVGLTLANYLGFFDVNVLVVEALPDIIDYPRGVGIDDESLRSFQAIGLIDEVLPHVTPNQWMRLIDGKGRVFASFEPRVYEYGWARRNIFIQPLADRALLEGLDRFEHAQVLFSHTMTSFQEQDDGVEVRLEDADERMVTVRGRYLVGCDGGRSLTRRTLDIQFPGLTESTRWLVVDVRDDPIGVPNSYLLCDPVRPGASIALPHGIRRFEFMLFPGEAEEEMVKTEALHEMVGRFVDDPERVDYIRQRIYTHHARIASTFRRGRAMIAGDAAHLMPVWQGQGYNSGVRDATNLGWKLAYVIKGLADPELLDSYEQERHDHAAMIDLSQNVGRYLVAPTNRLATGLRDAAARVLGTIPPVKRYILEQRFKPMPRYTEGAVVHERPIPKTSPVGRLFIQPRVTTREHADVMLDDVLGQWFAVLAWGTNPRRYLDDEALAVWRLLGARFFSVRPMTQLWWDEDDDPEITIIGDATRRLKDWFDNQPGSVIVLRPDRFVAGMSLAYDLSRLTKAFAAHLHALDEPSERRANALRNGGMGGDRRERLEKT
jgi:3-(3-hydroxy-phenyl)propionate hydroxylase